MFTFPLEESFLDKNLDLIFILMLCLFFMVVIYRIVFDIYCAKNIFSKTDDFIDVLKKNKNK